MIFEVQSLDEAVQRDVRPKVLFIVFPTTGRTQDASGFLSALSQYLPCDPEFHGKKWDAALGSVAGGLSNLPVSNIAVYWHGAERFKTASIKEYENIKADLRSLAEDIRDPQIMSRFVKDLVFYFGR